LILAIAAAAAIGAIVRFLLSALNRELPWGTLIANNLAVFSIPAIMLFKDDLATALVIGFAGALSTVSTFALEVVNSNATVRFRYVVLTLITCLASYQLAIELF
jgi:fluoride ion exporter CrcB/FEX